MIQTVFNGMIAVLVAKFIVNDLPHAAGLAGNPNEEEYYREKGYRIVRAFPPQPEWVSSAYSRLTERAPYIDKALSLDLEQGWLTQSKAEEAKTLMAGYYLIAQGTATDAMVSDVHLLLVSTWKRHKRDYAGMKDIVRFIGEGERARSRTDKAIWIDSAFYKIHSASGYSLPQVVDTHTGNALNRLLDELAK